ncbi:hypothetical protein [Micromonospora siamensis]|uniref:Uncharacterized protein n=1 Tax=Micromonospora siamensis TaxID=299152 RepID=A0A1C5JME6_9ACTN|nr:hypothetical protein [Micromonospora siamensis]SCG71740.1 hypothetical protein GA0074704_4677 [Micromonospora siamensis]
MRTTATPPVDALEQVLGELPLPWVVTAEDLKLALRALLVHAPEQWPTGPLCRADRTAYPCLLHRWARRVLRSRGLLDEVIDGLVERGGQLLGVPDGRS